MKSSLLTIVKIFVGIIISLAGIHLFLKGVDINLLLENIKQITPLSVFLAFFLALLTLYLRSIRWKLLLPEQHGASNKGLFKIVVIGFMVNNILPARIGEVLRAFILWERNKYTLAVSLGSLVVERVIDTVVFFVFFSVPVMLIGRLAFLKPYAVILLSISLAVLFVFFLYGFFKTYMDSLILSFVKLLPKKVSKVTEKVFIEVTKSMDWLHDSKKIVTIFILSPVISFCYSAIILVFIGKGTVHYGVIESLFSQASAAFGSAIPLAPGYIGTVHAAMRGSMNALGIAPQRATLCAILYHASNYIPVTILGLVYFFRMKLSFHDLRTIKKDMRDE